MEVEEENNSKHLQESTTTVSNESLLENNSMNDTELEIKVPESNTQEEQGEKSSVLSPKLDDPNPFDAVAVGETAEEKVVIVDENSEQTGGCWNSVVVEPTSLLKDENGAEGAANDGISTSDVAATESGGSELTNSTKVDVGEYEAAVIVRDNGLDAVEENANNSEEVTNTNGPFVIENDKDGSDDKMEEAGETMKEGGGVDVPLVPVAEIDEREEVMADVKSDGDEIVLGDEAITESQVDVQEADAEVVADEEEGLEEGNTTDDENAAGAAENEDEEPTLADEEKSLDTELETDEEATMADEEKVPSEEMETELTESVVKRGRRKRKRGGKNSKATHKSTVGRKKIIIDEDVCFICFDGGDLVLCDMRTCPKAYHPSCVNREASFFQTKGRWNCGWHLCSTCEKKAEYMCYTCTFSLCKSCIKTNVILCLKEKEKKGFCETCMKTIMLIEKNSQENQNQVDVDFDDKNSWEYLFKDYWIDMKSKLNLSLPDLLEAKNAWKGFDPAGKKDPPAVHSEGGSGSENPSPSPSLQTKKKRIRKPKKLKEDLKDTEWASKELLEFVAHMTGDDTSFQTQFDVQALLLEYIKTNKLRDSRRKSYIICDARLERLFGKPRVGHFEMLKLLESHFLIKEDSQIDDVQLQGDTVDTDVVQVDNDDEGNENVKSGKDNKKRKIRKKVDREPQSNRDDYAAIDTHNISLIYMRRKLVEDLLKDNETFHKKVFGTFVRIRIPGAHNKSDIYRLVQVTGTIKTEEYSVGKQKTDSMLEILNLDKTESVSIDTISNQEFTEDECKRLRQSIKCGLINRLKVGDILDKAMELQAARVDDWLELEVLRLSHLRDRASDLGRKKELRECVEKLQILKTPEERARRLEDLPVIHDDPTMDPKHVSEDDTDEDDKKQDTYKSSVGPRFNNNRRRDYPSKEPWSSTRGPAKNYEFARNLSFSNKTEPHNENVHDQGRDPIMQKKNEDSPSPSPSSSRKEVIPETTPEVNETEKMWHYKDPSGKIQGPFSMAQLRKWNNNKFFPVDLKIWRKSEKEDDGVLLTVVLEGRFKITITPPVKWGPKHDERDGFGLGSLPSPTPTPTPNQSKSMVSSSYHGGNEGLQSPTPSAGGPRMVAFGGGNNMPPPPVVQPVTTTDQSLSGGPYGWSGGAPHNPQPSPQWGGGGGVPNMVQNPAGNFLPPPPPVNLPPPPPPQPPPNVSWQPPPGNQSMNWGANVQGPQLTVNSPWGLQLQAGGGGGWVGPLPPTPTPTPAAGQGWVPGNGIGNPNWVAGEVNQGASSNMMSSGWVGGASEIGWGPQANQGWGSPTPRNRGGMWDRNEQNYNRSGFSGQKRNRGGGGGGGGGYTRH